MNKFVAAAGEMESQPPNRWNCSSKRIICTHRPREMERKTDRIVEAVVLQRRQVHGILADNGRRDVAVRAVQRWIDVLLVVLQTDAKSRLARADAFPRHRIRSPAAAVSIFVFAVIVLEVLQSQFE